MGVEGRGMVEVGQIPEQKTYAGISFPEVLVPSDVSLENDGTAVAEWVKQNREFINGVLHKSCAILFRGFGVKSAVDFNAFVEALGYPELPFYLLSGALRTQVVGRVFTANEAPPHQKISFHNDMALVNWISVLGSLDFRIMSSPIFSLKDLNLSSQDLDHMIGLRPTPQSPSATGR